MPLTTEIFQKWASELPMKVIEKAVVKQKAYILPAPFWATHYINDARHFRETLLWKLKNFKNRERATSIFCTKYIRHRLKILVDLEFLAFKRFRVTPLARSCYCSTERSTNCIDGVELSKADFSKATSTVL